MFIEDFKKEIHEKYDVKEENKYLITLKKTDILQINHTLIQFNSITLTKNEIQLRNNDKLYAILKINDLQNEKIAPKTIKENRNFKKEFQELKKQYGHLKPTLCKLEDKTMKLYFYNIETPIHTTILLQNEEHETIIQTTQEDIGEMNLSII